MEFLDRFEQAQVAAPSHRDNARRFAKLVYRIHFICQCFIARFFFYLRLVTLEIRRVRIERPRLAPRATTSISGPNVTYSFPVQ